MSLLSLLVSSTLRKKIWTFHEPVGQGGQGWLKGFSPPWPWLELLLALGLHFPTCKMGGGCLCSFTAYSTSAFAQRGPSVRAGLKDTTWTPFWPLVGVSPSQWQWLLPGLPAAHLCLCGRFNPKHPSFLKPYSRGQIQGRGGDRVWDTGVDIETPATWLTSFGLSCVLPLELSCSECRASGAP